MKLLQFKAVWCNPCKMQTKEFEENPLDIELQPIDVDNDNEVSISFSSKYMLDAIKSFGTEKVTLYINNDSSPIILKTDEDVSLIQLVLPIKTY